jgi:Transcriptional regulator
MACPTSCGLCKLSIEWSLPAQSSIALKLYIDKVETLELIIRLDLRIIGTAMEWLNYHHLLYFHMVAKCGSISAAGRELSLAPPTISAQLRSLEESLGEKLFAKSGRRLVLTDTGQLVMQYADEIFSLG